jgi:hypothetical protein
MPAEVLGLMAPTLTPRDLFEGKMHYEIPPYQRPYVWDEDRQWAPLWQDVSRLASSTAESLVSGKQPEVPYHFLGAVVYERRPQETGDVSRFPVVDGQQRMTTLQVLLDAVHQVLVERGHDDAAADLQELIVNPQPKYQGKPERFKLWPSRNDRSGFSQAMDPQQGWAGDHRIVDAHAFFRGETETWLVGKPDLDGNQPPGTEELRVQALCSVLQDRLVVVAINLPFGADSQIIFETLNDRGTRLLKADLIRNWVFRRGEELGGDTEAWSETHWAEFDDDWWREEIQQGRQTRSRIDIFLHYWLTMRVRAEIPSEQVFRVFSSHAGPRMSNLTDAEAFLAELKNDADTFRTITQTGQDPLGGAFFARVVGVMEQGATTPLLLWLLSKNHGVPEDQVRGALGALESWVVRRTLLRWTMKDVNKFMVTLLKGLDEVPSTSVGSHIRQVLAQQTADARTWPTDDQMMSKLPKQTLYGSVRQSRIREVLWAVENHIRDAKTEDLPQPSLLEVEHILPKAWGDHWDSEPPLEPEARDRRNWLKHSLGNLTLITKHLNINLSNRPWTDAAATGLTKGGESGKGKRTLLQEYSLLRLSKELIQENPTGSDEARIEARGRLMTERICKAWPGPPVQDDEAVAGPIASATGTGSASNARDKQSDKEATADAAIAGDPVDVLRAFNRAMQDVYVKAKQEAGYTATYYLEMLHQHGGLETAHRLLASSSISDGFTALWERKRLDLTVENVVLQPRFRSLFTEEELDTARQRLQAYGYEAVI